MRLFFFLSLLASVGVTSVAAQDPFEGVPVEPRPSEYILWDADASAEFKHELEGQLRDGEGVWGTPFVWMNAMPQAEHRPHYVQIIHRAGFTHPEIHATKWDIYVILDGSGTVLIGGDRVNWIDGLPPEEQSPRLDGAEEFPVTEGDMVHVPARVWHQMLVEPGASITYALINVIE